MRRQVLVRMTAIFLSQGNIAASIWSGGGKAAFQLRHHLMASGRRYTLWGPPTQEGTADVVVGFADLVGFTALGQTLEPTQIDAMSDPIAERVRKLGGNTIRSVGHIKRLQRVLDNDADYVTPQDMLAELRDDNKQLARNLRNLHELCDEHNDVATASLLENWIDETEQRVWFLFETSRKA